MPVSLTKIVAGNRAVSDSLPNEQTVKCPLCEQTFRLGYTDSEWNRVKDWLTIAERAIREEHKTKHAASSLVLEWKPARRKR
jgi:spore germination protein YaaH